jgi:phage/plasmid-associated DNA primase
MAPGQRKAIARRLRQIKCEADFSGMEGSDGEPIDGLAEILFAEEGPGIVAWMLEGYERYVARGCKFDTPPEVIDETARAMAAMSTWSAFCAEVFTIVRHHDTAVEMPDIYDLWRYFRGENSDQKHSRPSSLRQVPKALQEELRGIKVTPAHGSKKGTVTGITWSVAGRELLTELAKARNPMAAYMGYSASQN